MNKFLVAMGAFALLAALAWTTLSDPKFRLGTLAILGMFALRTWSWHKKSEHESREQTEEQATAESAKRGIT
jgi:membrane protein implicated in regulation of membrane protease activity